MSVMRINRFDAKAGAADELAAFLSSIVPIIKRLDGCESCRLLRSRDNIGEFLVLEVWASVAAHQASAQSIPPESIAKVMPLLSKTPAGSYYDE